MLLAVPRIDPRLGASGTQTPDCVQLLQPHLLERMQSQMEVALLMAGSGAAFTALAFHAAIPTR